MFDVDCLEDLPISFRSSWRIHKLLRLVNSTEIIQSKTTSGSLIRLESESIQRSSKVSILSTGGMRSRPETNISK